MLDYHHLPIKTTYLSDEELAQKFDLNLPQMTEVKTALEKKDAAALKSALIGYLNSKLPPNARRQRTAAIGRERRPTSKLVGPSALYVLCCRDRELSASRSAP